MPPPRCGANWCAGLTAMMDRRPRRIYGGDLPTARTTLYVRVLVFCNSCRHQADADLDAIVESGRGDVSLTELRFRCSQCGTHRTDFVVTSRTTRNRGDQGRQQPAGAKDRGDGLRRAGGHQQQEAWPQGRILGRRRRDNP